MKAHVGFAAVLMVIGCASAYCQISSTFDSNVDGWTAAEDGADPQP